MDETYKRLIGIVALANDYCATLEQVREMEKKDFLAAMLNYLPRLYWEFNDLTCEGEGADDDASFASFIDEDYYNDIRARVESVLGADDTYLETFEEDMKYSDTPIAASISEGLADIFQDLYNFVGAVRESEGDEEVMTAAYLACRDNFIHYWSQTLCNVLRPLNSLRHEI